MTEEQYRKEPESGRNGQAGKNAEKSRKKVSKARRGHARTVLLILSLLVLGAGGFGAMEYGKHREAIQAWWDIQPDRNARKGSLYEEPASEVAPGDFWVLVNQLPNMEAGSQECRIEYENPASNHYSARISLYLKENGNLLGHSRRVDPGNYVETIRIKKKLPIGEYPVKANIQLFQDQTPAGELSMDLQLRVIEAEEIRSK